MAAMRLAFVATEAAFEADEYALVCGVTGGGHHLLFQRDADDADEDWGIHLEFDDQANGGYGCVAACHLSRAALTVTLSQKLGGLVGITGFDIALDIDPVSASSLLDGLTRVFRGYADVLVVE